jgi:hypothetical protein
LIGIVAIAINCPSFKIVVHNMKNILMFFLVNASILEKCAFSILSDEVGLRSCVYVGQQERKPEGRSQS